MVNEYDVNKVEDTAEVEKENPAPSFCIGLRAPVAITLLIAAVLYCIGGIICGITFKSASSNYGQNCTFVNEEDPPFSAAVMMGFESNLVIVGPCFMSFGGAVLTTIFLQWCFCRPILSMMKPRYSTRRSSGPY